MRFRFNLLTILLTSIFCSITTFSTPTAQAQLLEQRLAETDLNELVQSISEKGDPQRGAVLFYQPEMNCATCHEPRGDAGVRLGPDLSERRDASVAHLVESVLNPHKVIREGFETAVIQTDDGDLVQGVLKEKTDETISISRIEQPESAVTFRQDEIQWKMSELSTMPTGLANQLKDESQFFDLISYLKSISVDGAVRAAQLRPASALFPPPPLPAYENDLDHASMIAELKLQSFERGKVIFDLHCASCHGKIDDDGIALEEGSMPTSLRFASGVFKNGNDPHTMYRTLTHGYGMMNAQRWMVPQQKYDVICYIREHYLRNHNPSQLFEVTPDYLASLPAGSTTGPQPPSGRPFEKMNYGPSFFNTVEVEGDFGPQGNIAQKGLTIRLDDGPGGVERGSHWLMYEHDTMRVSAGWSGNFINYQGIHFDGRHNIHPKVTGQVHFATGTMPGWASPQTDTLDDSRVLGRDDRRYGPLPGDWAHYRGMYRYSNRVILDYTVGETEILESPDLLFVNERAVFARQFNVGPRKQDLTLVIAGVGDWKMEPGENGTSFRVDPNAKTADDPDDSIPTRLDGQTYVQLNDAADFDMSKDFLVTAKIKTKTDGTILSRTSGGDEWVPGGQTIFIRDGRLCYDIGWVGVMESDRKVNDNRWHDVAIAYDANAGRIDFSVDGKAAGGGPIALSSEHDPIRNPVVRVGFTNDNFPATSGYTGELKAVRFLGGENVLESSEREAMAINVDNANVIRVGQEGPNSMQGLAIAVSTSAGEGTEIFNRDQHACLKIPAGDAPMQFTLYVGSLDEESVTDDLTKNIPVENNTINLAAFTRGGPANWPEKLKTEFIAQPDEGPFSVDVFTRPTDNPWNCRMRLTGVDFVDGVDEAIVTAWDGSVWRVGGVRSAAETGDEITWQRIAAGLFQPLGVRIVDGEIFVTCRDQLVHLHDLNGDGEMDWYENHNSDHQVTEHFHEFAMGLQTDDEGNFYYAKSARHALTALVPHHGTLLKVSRDGSKTEIVANGFRAANGVCINPDGSFYVTDQEGHWNPKNRINKVLPGGFYGNMFGYHDVTDESDSAMDPPLCWITNSFDRSPAELLWVDSPQWGSLNGVLLNSSYGFGQLYTVMEEKVNGRYQGGMCALPIPRFPTGVMRGRFHPQDGQLYCCGMFAWSGTQQQPGGFYRVRRTEVEANLPIGLNALEDGIRIVFSEPVDRDSAENPQNYIVNTWTIERTKKYGSKHLDEKQLTVTAAEWLDDGKAVKLTIPDIHVTRCMEIVYTIQSEEGREVVGRIHNTIHELAATEE